MVVSAGKVYHDRLSDYNEHNWLKVKVKSSHTRYRALGLELIPVRVQAVSPQVTISHPTGGRLPLLFARPAVTFPAA